MCKCKRYIEEKLLDRFKQDNPDATEHSAKLSGYSLIIGSNSIKQKGCMPIELTATHPLKKGGYKARTERSNMIFTFCPFCGERYEPKAGEQ